MCWLFIFNTDCSFTIVIIPVGELLRLSFSCIRKWSVGARKFLSQRFGIQKCHRVFEIDSLVMSLGF